MIFLLLLLLVSIKCSLLWSFIDTYFIAALAVLTLLPPPGVDDDSAPRQEMLTLGQLVSRAQKIGEQLFFQCCLDLFEAISKEQLQNAFKLYRHWSIFSIETSGAVKEIVKLTPEFATREHLLVLVVSLLQSSIVEYLKKVFMIELTF